MTHSYDTGDIVERQSPLSGFAECVTSIVTAEGQISYADRMSNILYNDISMMAGKNLQALNTGYLPCSNCIKTLDK